MTNRTAVLSPMELVRREEGKVRAMMRGLYCDGKPIRNANSSQPYSALARDLAPSVRPGAMDAFALPSRQGMRLVWPKGKEAQG